MSPQTHYNDWKTNEDADILDNTEVIKPPLLVKNHNRPCLIPIKNRKPRHILRLSVAKLKAIDMPEVELHRAVCLKNTVLHMQAEVRKARLLKRQLSSEGSGVLSRPKKRQRLGEQLQHSTDQCSSLIKDDSSISNVSNIPSTFAHDSAADSSLSFTESVLTNEDGETIPMEYFTTPTLVTMITDIEDEQHTDKDSCKQSIASDISHDSTEAASLETSQNELHHKEQSNNTCINNEDLSNCDDLTEQSWNNCQSDEISQRAVVRSCASQIQESIENDIYHMPVFSEC